MIGAGPGLHVEHMTYAMIVQEEVKLDFKDVLIRSKRSTLRSRLYE